MNKEKDSRPCLKEYKVFYFDLYGTLIDIHTDEEKPQLWQYIAEWFSDHSAEYTAQELKAAYQGAVNSELKRVKKMWAKQHITVEYPEPDIGKVFRRLYVRKGVKPDDGLIRDTAWVFRQKSTSHLRLYAGARNLLIKLRDAGKEVCVLSNAQSLFTLPELEQLGIAGLFDRIFISSDYGVKKPDPVFFRTALEERKKDAADCLMIGNDYECDILGAQRAGIEGFYILSNLSPKQCWSSYPKDSENADFCQRGMNLDKVWLTLQRYTNRNCIGR